VIKATIPVQHTRKEPSIAISLTDLQYRYADKPVVDIKQWQIYKGEKIFLYGDSGSGKSTLIHLLAGITKPTSGSIIIHDTDITQLSTPQRDRFRAHNMGLLYQQSNLIPYLSARENVMLASVLAKKNGPTIQAKVSQLLNDLNIEKALQNRAIEYMSIGQQQRVAIARAMINQPAILLMDEPTSALDDKNKERFINNLFLLLEAQQGTLLFVSHDKSLASHFDQSIELAKLNTVRAATCHTSLQ